ncbi:MAG TPA: chorismate mutase [Candidatus Angelobacter sp.]|jgi:chorismate mutase|nr:chorismate mutase [Candidatus Angelobacter sp.]
MSQQNATGEKTLDANSLGDKTPGDKLLRVKSSDAKSLEACRQQIDALDTELVRLLNQRAAIACEIALVKVAFGLPAYDGKREDQVLARVAAKSTGPLVEQSITAIFRSIIQETRRLGTEKMQEEQLANSK